MRISTCVIICVTLPGILFAQHQEKYFSTKEKRNAFAPASPLKVVWEKRVHQGYSMKVWISNSMTMGVQAWNPLNVPADHCSNPGIGLSYPTGLCFEHLYGAGPVIGGIVDGVRLVSEGYNGDNGVSEFIPESKDTLRDRVWHTHAGAEEFDSTGSGYSGYYFLHNIRINQRFVDDDGDGKIDEDELDGLDNDGDWNPLTDDLGRDGLADQLEISCDGKAYDAATNPDPAYDNYDSTGFDKCHLDAYGNFPRKKDNNIYTQNNGIPDHGEPHVDEDYGAVSDNDLYFASTDTFRSISLSGHRPMGVKIFMKSYAWKGEYGEAILPFDYYFVNVGQKVVHNVYLGMFADMDIGPVTDPSYPSHNYTCYIRELQTAYTANAQDRGATPLGITLLGAPRSLDSLSIVYQWYGFNDPGTNDSNIYSWMSGERWGYDLTQYIRICTSPSSPTDTRFFFSFGPFGDLAPHETLKVSLALVSGDAVDGGFNNMRSNAALAKAMYKRKYVIAPTPPSPPLHVTRNGNKVSLDWKWTPVDPGIDPLESWDEDHPFLADLPDTDWRKRNPPTGKGKGGRNFEGFKVWRSESPTFDSSSFALLEEYSIDPDPMFGYRSGIQYNLVDSNLRTGKTYWYAVTSYSIPDAYIQHGRNSNGNTTIDTIVGKSSESDIHTNATQVKLTFGPSKKLGEVMVVPNPYRADRSYTDGNGFEGSDRNWTDYDRVIWFIDLPPRATIRIYSLTGDVITTINHDDATRAALGLFVGQEEWHLFSESGRAITSGIYVFSVDSELGQQVGKFVVIR